MQKNNRSVPQQRMPSVSHGTLHSDLCRVKELKTLITTVQDKFAKCISLVSNAQVTNLAFVFDSLYVETEICYLSTSSDLEKKEMIAVSRDLFKNVLETR